MKSRIISSLVEISEGKNENLQKTIAAESGMDISSLPAKASQVLDNILHDYSGFGVSTIDSFFSTIVRSLARELNLPLRFDIELNIDSVIGEVTRMMLDDIGTNKWLRKWLQDFIFDKLNEGKSWKIEADIHNLAYELFKESYRKNFANGPAAPDSEFINQLRKIIKDFELQMVTYGQTVLKSFADNNLDISDFAFGKTGVANYFTKITKRIKPADYIPGERVKNAFDDPAQWAAKKSPRREEIIALASSTFIPASNNILKFLESDLPSYTGAKLVLNTIHMAGIFSIMDEKLKIFRDENEIVLISDTNQLLQKAIEGTDAPFIYEKTGNRYSHFMLDEFQDTSDFQWQNLLPLIENALGAGNFAMIVGDAKQSIYRWRGGNMQLLLTGIQKNLNSFHSITGIKNLADNYRSREQIVNFNNDFFEIAPQLLLPAPENESLRIAYQSADLRQQWKKGNADEGYVKISILDGGKSRSGSDDEDAKSDWKEKACKENLEIIKNVFELGFEYRDIAFLTRTNQDAKIITEYLIANGIHRIISPESMLLNRSLKIRFLVNLLQFIDTQDDDIILAHLVYYWNSIKKPDNKYSLHQLFSETRRNKLEMLPATFTKKIQNFRKMPLFEAVEELSILFELGSPLEAYLQRFFDLILEYSKRHPANITDFLEWWEENQEKDTCSVIIPSGENAIRVMSIHKSKGLQFPVVIIPFADWDLRPKSQSVHWMKSKRAPFNNIIAHPLKFSSEMELSVFKEDYEKELQQNYIDNLNLLYVAFTRAEEQLYIITKKPSASRSKRDSLIPCTSGELINDTLIAKMNFTSAGNAEADVFEKGKCAPPLHNAPGINAGGRTLTKWFSNSWKPRIKMGINKKKISIDDPETPETSYGILFHSLLAEINTHVNANTFVKTHQSSESLDNEIQQRLIKEISMFTDAADLYGWFNKDYKIVNEAELLLPGGSILRPDRLMLHENKAVVIDYKTGVEEEHHSGQVLQYADVLKQMGYTETKMFLVYPAISKVVEIAAA